MSNDTMVQTAVNTIRTLSIDAVQAARGINHDRPARVPINPGLDCGRTSTIVPYV
jgi:hypothetical protein